LSWTKASRLEQLLDLGFGEYLLPQVTLVRSQIENQPELARKEVTSSIGITPLAVRSSARDEDQEASNAGRYLSLLNVPTDELLTAAQTVLNSYSTKDPHDSVLVQPYLEEVVASGVVFTKDPNTGSDYWVVNWVSGTDTTAVTSGTENGKSLIVHSSEVSKTQPIDGAPLDQLFEVVARILEVTGENSQDIEWAATASGVYIVQIRPLSTPRQSLGFKPLSEELARLQERVLNIQREHPYLVGKTTVFGVMPDWNPAELIGIRPNTLAFTLFTEIISDSIWAYERSNLGYRNLRSFPLILDFAGQPYVDVRVSLNSLIPADIPNKLASRLADFYLEKLVTHPELHDKLEFNIAISCFSFDWKTISEELQVPIGEENLKLLRESLIRLTRNAISSKGYGLKQMFLKQAALDGRYLSIRAADLDSISKSYWLLEDCKRYGSLPFAGIARLAFIATRMLHSLVSIGVINQDELVAFTSSIDTPAGQMVKDLRVLSKESFLLKYGHLRPGTFDITKNSYMEQFDTYFPSTPKLEEPTELENNQHLVDAFKVKLSEFSGFSELGIDASEFIDFCREAIAGREESKFHLSRNVSAILDEIKKIGKTHGFEPEQMSHVKIETIRHSYFDPGDIKSRIEKDISEGLEREALSQATVLPPLIKFPSEVKTFEIPATEANFITLLSSSGPLVYLRHADQELEGKFVLIESADPGFDWIFARQIKGLITCWGGANSHMAIRAKELKLPAAIGVGESLFRQLRNSASSIHLDCRNRRLEIIR
jgi:hypothetical protein